MHYYYGSTKGRGHTWLLTADEQRRDFKSLSALIASWSFLMQAIHFPMFSRYSFWEGGGYSSQRSAHRQCLHSAGAVPHHPIASFGKEMDSSASAFVGLTADKTFTASETLKERAVCVEVKYIAMPMLGDSLYSGAIILQGIKYILSCPSILHLHKYLYFSM